MYYHNPIKTPNNTLLNLKPDHTSLAVLTIFNSDHKSNSITNNKLHFVGNRVMSIFFL